MAAHVTALPASALFWRRTGADGWRAAFRAHWRSIGAALARMRCCVPSVYSYHFCDVHSHRSCDTHCSDRCTAPVPVRPLHQRSTRAPFLLVARCSLYMSTSKSAARSHRKHLRAILQEKKFGKVLAKQIPLCIIPSYKFFDENTTFRLLCYSESGMVKADRASANRYHL